MVDIEKIKAEIVALENLSADDYLAEKIAELKAEFEANREAKIKELKSALEIFDKYQIVEEVTEEVAEEQNENPDYIEE